MKLVRLLIAASLLAGVAPNVVFADCDPPCKGSRVCRYDSTHDPQFFCRKPAAPQAAPAASGVAPAPATGYVSKIDLPSARSKDSTANSKTSQTGNCKWDGPELGSTNRARPQKC